jgi:hypothetical protein
MRTAPCPSSQLASRPRYQSQRCQSASPWWCKHSGSARQVRITSVQSVDGMTYIDNSSDMTLDWCAAK